jgi:hypothetical protein
MAEKQIVPAYYQQLFFSQFVYLLFEARLVDKFLIFQHSQAYDCLWFRLIRQLFRRIVQNHAYLPRSQNKEEFMSGTLLLDDKLLATHLAQRARKNHLRAGDLHEWYSAL